MLVINFAGFDKVSNRLCGGEQDYISDRRAPVTLSCLVKTKFYSEYPIMLDLLVGNRLCGGEQDYISYGRAPELFSKDQVLCRISNNVGFVSW